MSKFKLGAWFHRAGKLLRGRTFTAAGLAVAVGLSLWAVAENVKILYIADGAETGVTLALRSDPTEQALSRAGITLKENDTVTTRETALVYSRVSISRGVSVTLVADGRETPCTVTGGTVAELLEQNSITLGENDYCDKELSALLEDGDVITVRRVEKKVVKEQVAIPCDTVYKSSSLLRNGRSMLITEGTNGLAENTYEELWSGDTLISRELVSTKEVTAPAAPWCRSQRGAAISRLDWSDQYPLDANGIPVNYEKVKTGQKATGYSAGENSYGSSGGYCYYGTIAVNPKEYPYGTKLYIRSSDGSFVYGYALASDTGGFISGEVGVDVDLFYEDLPGKRSEQPAHGGYLCAGVGQRDAVLLKGYPKTIKQASSLPPGPQKLRAGFLWLDIVGCGLLQRPKFASARRRGDSFCAYASSPGFASCRVAIPMG